MSRQADLVRATQYLEEMNFLEGYFGGTFTLIGDQLYHLQNALVLASESVDMLAGLMARLSEADLPPRKISWAPCWTAARTWADISSITPTSDH